MIQYDMTMTPPGPGILTYMGPPWARDPHLYGSSLARDPHLYGSPWAWDPYLYGSPRAWDPHLYGSPWALGWVGGVGRLGGVRVGGCWVGLKVIIERNLF